MGYATVISPIDGLPGKFLISIDSGEEQRKAMLDAVNARMIIINDRIAQQFDQVQLADAREAAIKAQLVASIAEITLYQQTGETDLLMAAVESYSKHEVPKLVAEQTRNVPMRIALRKMKDQLAESLRLANQWAALKTVEQREAWCVTYTENIVQEFVQTLEINGEPDHVLVGPNGAAPQNSDGALLSRELMSPEQVYFNAAVLPGWQKDLPTYRTGKLTFVDWDANLCNVSLDDARSSAQGLSVNKTPQVNGIRFDYMACNAKAFDNDSRVVLKFPGQSWDDPVVIGFVDTPRKCPPIWTGEDIPDYTVCPDSEVSIPIIDFSGGQGKLTFESVDGLPEGLGIQSFDDSCTVVGRIAAGDVNAKVQIRCSDELYIEGKNKRFADSPVFSILTLPRDWDFPTGDVSMGTYSHQEPYYHYCYPVLVPAPVEDDGFVYFNIRYVAVSPDNPANSGYAPFYYGPNVPIGRRKASSTCAPQPIFTPAYENPGLVATVVAFNIYPTPWTATAFVPGFEGGSYTDTTFVWTVGKGRADSADVAPIPVLFTISGRVFVDARA